MSGVESIVPGRLDWTGENPGILLKNDEGDFTAMSLFFRVAWSPVGPGELLLLYASPSQRKPAASKPNLLIGNNRALAEYLVNNFIGKLAAFRDAPAFGGLEFAKAQTFVSSGDPQGNQYSEAIGSPDHAVQLVWRELEPPRALRLSPELTGTGEHDMFTVLVPAREAHIFLDGNALPGSLGRRVQAGFETTTAFLYFSETWIIPARD